MDKLRREFEFAYDEQARQGGCEADFRTYENGDYKQPAVYWAFWGWQASRAALKVKLPASVTVNLTETRYIEAIEMKNALNKAGISYG